VTEQEVISYCLKCRAKRPLLAPTPVYTTNGAPALRGTCSVCGSQMVKMGATPAHASLPKPEPQSRAKRAHKTSSRPIGKLVIVESPAKARTIARFLGSGYRVEASVGHVRDLLRSKLSVDVEHDFVPHYHVPKEKREVVARLKEAVSRANQVYLATDPDREGEAIAWHVMEAANVPAANAQRVVFHEITDEAVRESFANPRALDMDLVNAQQARRVLDRLVGYQISPLLWERVQGRLSAGRVQSVAVRLVVERERAIQAFVPVEYWSILAELAKQDSRGQQPRPSFRAKLAKIGNQDVDLKDQPATQSVVDDLQVASYFVRSVQESKRQKKAPAPFITSTLQQEAFRKLGMSAKRTMMIAQQLYEGISLGAGERVGLITYMRTDSTHIAPPALAEVRSYIARQFGSDYLPETPPVHKTRAVKAQEAHECIRPTSVQREPEAVQASLDRDQFRLYQLIWKRFVASQMTPAVYDVTSVQIKAGRVPAGSTIPTGRALASFLDTLLYLFRVTGSTLVFPGFLRLYEESQDEGSAGEDDVSALPPLVAGEPLDLLRLIPEQHFTEPPPRYTEASLVQELEKHGIGRPSTYAPILATIQTREYVERQDRHLLPTQLGFTVNDLLVKHFPDIVDLEFTAGMENDLDKIADGDRDWVEVLREFYGPFERTLHDATQNMEKVELAPQLTGLTCEKCGSPMIVKTGRFGRFIACSNYPTCRNTKPFVIKTGARCPSCGGDLIERKTRQRRTFFGCSNYPTCTFSLSKRPLAQPCPHCGGLLTEAGKKKARCSKCGTVFDQGEDIAATT
jgi:DNA topoisomerase I